MYILYDNILKVLTEDELVAVFAHEMGHGLHKDSLKRFPLSFINIALIVILAWLLVKFPQIYTDFGFNGVNYGFAVILLFECLASVVFTLLRIPLMALSRHQEYKADEEAVKEGYADQLISGLKKLYRNDLGDLNPDPLVVALSYSHPTLYQRIKNIYSLTTKKMEKLKILDLAINEIDDSNIVYFYALDFPELSKLNIFQNKITNVEIFQFKNNKKNLPKLEIFYIGSNIINFDEKNINIKKTKYDLSSIKEIGFSLQVFSQKTINFIHCFTLIDIEFLYLNSNNLENLDFVEDLDLPHIKQFWLNNNQITNFQPLEKFKTLERIEMENNKIENIDFLEDFFGQVKNLQLFNLKRNNIMIGFANRDFFEIVKEEKKALFDPNIGLFG